MSTIPERSAIGDTLNFASAYAEIQVTVELPFWLMVPRGPLTVDVEGHTYLVTIEDAYVEIFAREATDSRVSVIFQGPPEAGGQACSMAVLNGTAALPRKCKTVLRITSRCPEDVLAAASERGRRAADASWYLIALCSAHLPVVNRIVMAYRTASYDPAAYEVSPWDVPVWFVRAKDDAWRVSVLPEADHDFRPTVKDWKDRDDPTVKPETVHLTTLEAMIAESKVTVSSAESALLDADSLMHRGDYSGAVRRTVTAIEVLVEVQLRSELSKTFSAAEVEDRLERSRNDFPGRLRQLTKVTGRPLADALEKQLTETRRFRHQIVHGGRRITYGERGLAQKCVDMGRWTFNAIENDAARKESRESSIVRRNLGRHFVIFRSSLGPDGVTVARLDASEVGPGARSPASAATNGATIA